MEPLFGFLDMIDVVIEHYFRVRRSDWVFGGSHMLFSIRSYLRQYGYLKVVWGIILKYRENSRYREANKCNVLKYGVIYIELFAGSVVLYV